MESKGSKCPGLSVVEIGPEKLQELTSIKKIDLFYSSQDSASKRGCNNNALWDREQWF